jgi:glycosyltransferase involved in cell wall biosynthesis
MPFISVVVPCYNEEDNVEDLYQQVKAVFAGLPGYTYEHLFIDNASTDRTVEKLRALAAQDENVKVIVNVRNFGQIRSPYHAIFQASGEAIITMCADLQDPPALLPEFIHQWEKGYKVVMGVKSKSQESPLLYALRTAYYRTLRKLSDVDLVENYTGFGLYDRQVVEQLRLLNDPYPYFRGLIAELGYERAIIEYTQPLRRRGITKNNFYTLYDMALLGLTSHSRVPLRLATMLGFVSAAFSILVAIFYFVYKLLYWNDFSVGLAPLVVGIFFFSSVQLFFLGMVGEYVGAIYTQVLKRPLVIEKERINFKAPESKG